jgi:hypothetical protein
VSFYMGGDSSHLCQSYLHYFLRGFMPLNQEYPAFLLGLCLMCVCACGGSCFPRGARRSGRVLWSVGRYVIFWLERTIMSSMLYNTHIHGDGLERMSKHPIYNSRATR